jgi:hypothetical protein
MSTLLLGLIGRGMLSKDENGLYLKKYETTNCHFDRGFEDTTYLFSKAVIE